MKDEKPQQDQFRGYTIDELRYRRAYALAKYEMAKLHTTEQVDVIKTQAENFAPKGVLGKVLKSLDFVDYALVGYRVYRAFRQIGHRRKS